MIFNYDFCIAAIVHKFVKDKYQKRFPELDSLIMVEMDYIRSVKELGNDLDQAKNNERLQEILTQATIMIVSVTASTTQGWVLVMICTMSTRTYLQLCLTIIKSFPEYV